MPLIQLTDFATVGEYLDHMKQVKPETVLASFENIEFKYIFLNRLKYHLLLEEANQMPDVRTSVANVMLYNFINASHYGYVGDLKRSFKLHEFFLKEDQYFFTTAVLNSEEKILVIRNQYFEWLDKQEARFVAISKLENPYVMFNNNQFKNVMQNVKRHALLDLDKMNSVLQNLWSELDASYEKTLKSIEGHLYVPYRDKNDIPNFDWDYYKSPIPLQLYPAALKDYKKNLFAWLKDQMHFRKTQLKWETTPVNYVFMETFITALAAEISEIKKKTLPDKHQEKFQNDIVNIVADYPKHIFKSKKDHDFFCQLAKKATTAKQLSFLYRIMAEKENPAMILVKDTPFRNWFNSQTTFEIVLENHTETLVNATNKDREWAYQIAKETFYNKE